MPLSGRLKRRLCCNLFSFKVLYFDMLRLEHNLLLFKASALSLDDLARLNPQLLLFPESCSYLVHLFQVRPQGKQSLVSLPDFCRTPQQLGIIEYSA